MSNSCTAIEPLRGWWSVPALLLAGKFNSPFSFIKVTHGVLRWCWLNYAFQKLRGAAQCGSGPTWHWQVYPLLVCCSLLSGICCTATVSSFLAPWRWSHSNYVLTKFVFLPWKICVKVDFLSGVMKIKFMVFKHVKRYNYQRDFYFIPAIITLPKLHFSNSVKWISHWSHPCGAMLLKAQEY